MSHVAVGDARLFYRESGTGDALILVHDAGFNADVWADVVPRFATSQRVITYDRRAYQRSPGPPPPRSTYHRQHGEDLAGLIVGLDAAPADVLAWGSATFPALHAALAHPRHFRRLVIYDPPFGARRSPNLANAWTALRMRVARWRDRPERAAEVFLRRMLSYDDGANSMDHLSPALRESMRKDLATLLAEVEAGTGEEFDPVQLRSEMQVPVSILLGESSPPFLLQSMKRMTAALPQPPVLMIDNANHLAHVDDPEAFVAATNRALYAA